MSVTLIHVLIVDKLTNITHKMAAASDTTSSTEQLQRFLNNLWQHQQKNDFCDFTLTTNNTSIECHKVVLSSASSYFSQLLSDSEHNTNIIDVTPLPEHILRTVVAFMYNSEYVIDDDNVIGLVKLSRTWNLDVLSKLCVTYTSDNITINNACRFYNFALEDDDQHLSAISNMFIREHFTSLHESGQLRELTPKNFTTIINHDEINVKNEDMVFNSAVQIINQQTSVEDINRCLELIRFPHTTGDFLVKVILDHPLMRVPPRDKIPREALLYQLNKSSSPEVKSPRHWQGTIYYIGKDHCMYQYECKAGNNECIKVMDIPEWVDEYSSVALDGKRMLIVGGGRTGTKRALLVDMTCNNKITKEQGFTALELPIALPDLPVPLSDTGVLLSHNGLYVMGGYDDNRVDSNSVYYFSPGIYTWQTRKSMPHAVSCLLVIQFKRCIYVLGGFDIDGNMQSTVSQYNIEDDTWKECGDMPEACSSEGAGIVVHENRIKVNTKDRCMMYDDDTDTWAVQQYDDLGGRVKTFIERRKIWAVVRNGTYRLMTYVDVDNVWNTELEGIDNALYTTLFC